MVPLLDMLKETVLRDRPAGALRSGLSTVAVNGSVTVFVMSPIWMYSGSGLAAAAFLARAGVRVAGSAASLQAGQRLSRLHRVVSDQAAVTGTVLGDGVGRSAQQRTLRQVTRASAKSVGGVSVAFQLVSSSVSGYLVSRA